MFVLCNYTPKVYFSDTKYTSNAPCKLFLYYRCSSEYREYPDGKDLVLTATTGLRRIGRASHLGKKFWLLRGNLCKGAGFKAEKTIRRILLEKM